MGRTKFIKKEEEKRHRRRERSHESVSRDGKSFPGCPFIAPTERDGAAVRGFFVSRLVTRDSNLPLIHELTGRCNAHFVRKNDEGTLFLEL